MNGNYKSAYNTFIIIFFKRINFFFEIISMFHLFLRQDSMSLQQMKKTRPYYIRTSFQ